MKCCKADKYGGWCVNEKTVEHEDEVYCIFHAPQGAKGITLEQFNGEIHRILANKSNLRRECIFSGTIFEGDISFKELQLDVPWLDFGVAVFNGAVDFSDFVLAGRITFAQAKFKKGVSCTRAKFDGGADFFLAEFTDPDAGIYFIRTEFGKETLFLRTDFAGPTYFTSAIFKEAVEFLEALFSKKVDFSRVTFGDNVYFTEETFLDQGDFKNIVVKSKVTLQNANLRKVSFEDSELRYFDFIGCSWPRNKSGERILYDEIKIPQESKAMRKVEILYRRLKKKYIDEHDWPEVSNWHYNEKKMAMKSARLQNLPLYAMYQLYDGFCGYGEKPGRAARMFVLLIVFFSVSTAWAGLEPVGEPSVWVGKLGFIKKKLMYVLNTLQNITFQKATYFEPMSSLGAWLKFFSRVIVPAQAAFVIFTLRNRFRR